MPDAVERWEVFGADISSVSACGEAIGIVVLTKALMEERKQSSLGDKDLRCCEMRRNEMTNHI